ncbi:MAG: hypothetical protein K8H99_11330 [Nitrospirae bacterium]|nr:hypothetical protein [Fimbriimonadaceae bacterium]
MSNEAMDDPQNRPTWGGAVLAAVLVAGAVGAFLAIRKGRLASIEGDIDRLFDVCENALTKLEPLREAA